MANHLDTLSGSGSYDPEISQQVSDCPRNSAQCNFEPRYDTSGPTPEQLKAIWPDGMSTFDDGDYEMMHRLGNSTYVCEICTHCGRKVAR